MTTGTRPTAGTTAGGRPDTRPVPPWKPDPTLVWAVIGTVALVLGASVGLVDLLGPTDPSAPPAPRPSVTREAPATTGQTPKSPPPSESKPADRSGNAHREGRMSGT